MAITSASFVPEQRDMFTGYADKPAASPAPQESVPSTHPVTGTQLPQSTGAGKGSVRKGLVRGK